MTGVKGPLACKTKDRESIGGDFHDEVSQRGKNKSDVPKGAILLLMTGGAVVENPAGTPEGLLFACC